MYGHTVKALERLEENLSSRGLNVKAIDAAEVHISDVLSEANNSAGLIVMFPTYDASIPMPLYEALYTFQVKMFSRGRPVGAESFFTLIEAFLISVVDLCWERMTSHADASCAQKGGGDCVDVSPVPLGSKESHDPPAVKLGRWLKAKPLRSTTIT